MPKKGRRQNKKIERRDTVSEMYTHTQPSQTGAYPRVSEYPYYPWDADVPPSTAARTPDTDGYVSP